MNRMDRRRRRAVARTPEGHAARERQRQVNRQLRVWTPRRIFGWTLAAVAVVVAVVHWTAHLGYGPIPLSMGAQDLLLGYPAAALLGVVAAIILGQTTTRRR
jgi:hypothetical protein